MIISLFLRHFKIYKGINYIPLSEGENFASIIGENGCGKSSVLEALDHLFNKRNSTEWSINNEAKSEGISGDNFPFLAPLFLIKKEKLKNITKVEQELFVKATKLSNFLWNTTYKTKGKFFEDFYKHRDSLKKLYSENEYYIILIGRKFNDNGIYFSSFHKQLTFINEKPNEEYPEEELQKYFKGFYDYIVSHYSYIYIPVETDVHTYTKLETQDMQKLMDRNIQKEIEKAIKPETIKQINRDLSEFVKGIEKVLEIYHYKGHYKDNLTMPDLVSKIIEAYFSIKILNKRVDNSKSIPVSELSSGEKRKALIDVAYSFLVKNSDRENNIILAIDEPEASLHISNCFEQFDKLFKISKDNHQIIVSTHWYGYLPITANGTATAIKKSSKNEITTSFLNLYNYRENIIHTKKLLKGPLPIDYNIKSYNDLVQSIIHSILNENSYNWIICEGQSEKIYFEYYFKKEIENNKLRLLPVGGFKEVHKIYNYLSTPIKDPDYNIKGKVLCLVDTDAQRIQVDLYVKDKNLLFDRLILKGDNSSILVEVNDNLTSPPTEIEDCLNPYIFWQTLLEFTEKYKNLERILLSKEIQVSEKYSANFLDLTRTEQKVIKDFFDDNEGYNKLLFAKKYIEIADSKFFAKQNTLDWIDEIKKKLKLQ